MKISKILSLSIIVALIGISLFGVFEERSLNFISGVYQNNLSFLALITEVKLIMSGISSIKIPFVDGATGDVNETIGKIQEFLLVTDVITFSQVLLISISKSWILKLFTIGLFLLTFIKKTKVFCSKLLLISLALNPGLILYTVAVQQISQEASIDFGDKYLEKLKVSVTSIKAEKSALMKQHASDITKINNGHKGIHILKKFREDIAYDFKKVKLDAKGAHANIRLLIHEGAHEMTSKIYGFCTMIIFTMVLLPLGYVLLIYLLFNHLFKNELIKLAGEMRAVSGGRPINAIESNYKAKWGNVFKAYKSEFHSIEAKVENSTIFQKAKSEVETVEGSITDKVKSEFRGEVDKLKTEITAHASKLKAEMGDKISQEKSKITQGIEKVETKVKSKGSGAVKTGKGKDSDREGDVPPDVLAI